MQSLSYNFTQVYQISSNITRRLRSRIMFVEWLISSSHRLNLLKVKSNLNYAQIVYLNLDIVIALQINIENLDQ